MDAGSSLRVMMPLWVDSEVPRVGLPVRSWFSSDFSRRSSSSRGGFHFWAQHGSTSGVRSGTGGGGLTSIRGSGHSSLTRSSSRGTTTSYSGPCRCCPRVVICLWGSNNERASPTASGPVPYLIEGWFSESLLRTCHCFSQHFVYGPHSFH